MGEPWVPPRMKEGVRGGTMVSPTQDRTLDTKPQIAAFTFEDAAVTGAVPARHRCFPGELCIGDELPDGLEHRLRAAGEDVARIHRKELGDASRLDDDLGARKKARRLCMALAPKAEHSRCTAERLREIRHRRDPDPARDEQRPSDVEVEAVPERTEDVDCVPGTQRAECTRARSDRVDEECKLTGRRLAEAHRTRQHSSRCLEHEELAGDSWFQATALETKQRVRPHPLGRDHPQSFTAGRP